MLYEDNIYKLTLAFINKLREEAGAEPLDDLCKGYKHAPFDCPVANSLADAYEGVVVSSNEIAYDYGDFATPGPVEDFINAFDDDFKYPELDESR